MMDSGCFSAESCGTMMAMSEALTGGADDDTASDAGSASSEASVTAAPALGNNPFAMAGEEQVVTVTVACSIAKGTHVE